LPAAPIAKVVWHPREPHPRIGIIVVNARSIALLNLISPAHASACTSTKAASNCSTSACGLSCIARRLRLAIAKPHSISPMFVRDKLAALVFDAALRNPAGRVR
jgi:hypothetical protein